MESFEADLAILARKVRSFSSISCTTDKARKLTAADWTAATGCICLHEGHLTYEKRRLKVVSNPSNTALDHLRYRVVSHWQGAQTASGESVTTGKQSRFHRFIR